MDWLRYWDFLELIGNLGQLGITICPGCAARLSPPTSVHSDGRRYHSGCHRVCSGCGNVEQRDNDSGAFVCRNDQCARLKEWIRDFKQIMTRIAYQESVDRLAKAKGMLAQEQKTAQPIAAQLTAQQKLARDLEDKKLIQEAQRQVEQLRYRGVDMRAWRLWVQGLVNVFYRIAYQYHHDRNAFTRARREFLREIGKIQDQYAIDRRNMRMFKVFWKQLVAAHNRMKSRLLNADLIGCEDGTDLRFAQLEIN